MSDMKINGHGTMTGGEYDLVSINGSAKCEGLLSAQRIHVNGTFQCPGVLKADRLGVNGNFRCDGDLSAQEVRVDGRLKCTGTLRAGLVNCDGAADVDGDVFAERLDVDGSFRVLGGTRLEATTVQCDGFIKIDGQISADLVEARGFINAREIVGDKVVIRSLKNRFVRLFTDLASKAELIEATTIELDGVTATTVNGRDIKIGPCCVIEHLDCTGTLSIDPSAVVRNITGDYQQLG